MVLKIIISVICALLLVICYRPRGFAEKVLRKSGEEITDGLLLKLKLISLALAAALFAFTMLFCK